MNEVYYNLYVKEAKETKYIVQIKQVEMNEVYIVQVKEAEMNEVYIVQVKEAEMNEVYCVG